MSHPIVADLVPHLNPNLREAWEERAAILEFDGGITHDFAEALALLVLLRQYPNELSQCLNS